MRSLVYWAALLPLHSLNVLANAPEEADVIIEVTTTRTVTVCPLTEFHTCEADVLPTAILPWEDWTNTPSGSAATTTTSKGSDHSGSWGTPTGSSFPGSGSTTSGTGYWTTTAGPGSVTSTSTSVHYGNSTTTSTLTSTTTSACLNSTATSAVSLETPRCNSPEHRGDWCHGKSIDDDTHRTFFTGQTKKYTLTITEENINYDGTFKPSFAVNGQSPGEAIVANWGDMVEVTVVNGLTTNATTIHWHGIRQLGTNDQDGVPGVSECGIAPGASRVYKWVSLVKSS